MPDFADKIALITGASGGIGQAIARRYAELGGRVGLVGTNRDRLNELARTRPDCFTVYVVDFRNLPEIENLVANVSAKHERLDALIHAAGVYVAGATDVVGVEELDHLYAVNTRAPYALTRGLLPLLRKGQGEVVFINSSAVLRTADGIGSYAATKHGLRALADSLRREVNADGIRVLSVFPGRTATPMQEAIAQGEGRQYHPDALLQPDDIASLVIHAIGLPRTAEVTELFVRPMRKS